MSIIIHGQGHSVTIVGTKCLTRDVNTIVIMLFGPYTLTACNVTSFNTNYNYMVLYIFQRYKVIILSSSIHDFKFTWLYICHLAIPFVITEVSHCWS